MFGVTIIKSYLSLIIVTPNISFFAFPIDVKVCRFVKILFGQPADIGIGILRQ